MSLELDVPLGQINLLQDITPLEVARALAALLGTSDFPIVEIEVLPKLKPRHSASLLVRFQGMEDAVVITESEIGVCLPQVTPDEANRWATMSAVGRTPTSYLLAAAVAIALARKAGTVVLDDALFWCSELESPPDEFLAKLRLQSPASALEEGTDRFYQGLLLGRRRK
jgi:hypothetical protein